MIFQPSGTPSNVQKQKGEHMSKKGENIYRRKDGRWEGRFIKARDSSGKIRYGYCYGKTYREVKHKVLYQRTAAAVPDVLTDARRPFREFCDEWMQQQKFKIKDSTYVKYDSILRKYIKPEFGGILPNQIDLNRINIFGFRLLTEKKLSVKTVRDILALLHAILKAGAAQYPDLFPTVEMQYPKERRKEARVLNHAEQERFCTYLLEEPDPCRFGIFLALFTGLRVGELCALRWDNISISERTLNITGTMQRLRDMSENPGSKTKIVIGMPKSETSARLIPLSDKLAAFCRQMRPDVPDAYVLTGTSQYMEPRTLQYRFQKYAKACDLSDVHFHTLRHTFATRCIEAGFELKSLSEILGHANTGITMNRYVHSSLEAKRLNMNKLEIPLF